MLYSNVLSCAKKNQNYTFLKTGGQKWDSFLEKNDIFTESVFFTLKLPPNWTKIGVFSKKYEK